MAKPVIGIFSLTCCSGCQLEILNNEDLLLEIVDKIKITHFPMAQENNSEGPFDIAFVEGSASNQEQIDKLKDIREKSKFLVALGTCAVYGGVQAIRSYMKPGEAEKIVYNGNPPIKSTDSDPLSKHVKVDACIRECPINKDEFVSVLKQLLVGKIPKEKVFPVCVECRKKENACLLQEGKFCMGPVTYGGCGALCPSHNTICNGCRGPIEDATIIAEIEKLEKNGMKMEEIKKLFNMFTGKFYDEAEELDKKEIKKEIEKIRGVKK